MTFHQLINLRKSFKRRFSMVTAVFVYVRIHCMHDVVQALIASIHLSVRFSSNRSEKSKASLYTLNQMFLVTRDLQISSVTKNYFSKQNRLQSHHYEHLPWLPRKQWWWQWWLILAQLYSILVFIMIVQAVPLVNVVSIASWSYFLD